MFKRNQLEEAILRSANRDETFQEDETRIRMKRLLDLDRKSPPDPTTLHAQNYAFYSGPPPGTGREVLFSSYEVFAVWVGLQLMKNGYPQGWVVYRMRYYREALEHEHKWIGGKDLAFLYRKSRSLTKQATNAYKDILVREGRLVEKIADMVFLAIRSERDDGFFMFLEHSGDGYKRPSNICRGPKELIEFLEKEAAQKRPVLTIELVNPALQLAFLLERIEPTRRGRR